MTMTSMPSSLARAHHFGGADAGIHADDQLHALGRGAPPPLRGACRSRPSGDAARDKSATPPASSMALVSSTTRWCHPRRSRHRSGSSRDRGWRCAKALDGGRHVAQGQRIVQIFEGRGAGSGARHAGSEKPRCTSTLAAAGADLQRSGQRAATRWSPAAGQNPARRRH